MFGNVEIRRDRRWQKLALALAAAGAMVGCDARAGAAPVAQAQTRPAPQIATAPVAPVAQATPPLTQKTQTPEAARSLSTAFSATAKAVRPSVVRIDVEKEAPRLVRGPGGARQGDPFGGQLPPGFRRFFDFGEGQDFPEMPMPGPVSGTGSGFILDSAGHILTNSHVVDGGAKLKVTLEDGRELPARIVARDSRTDVAVVRLEQPPANLTAARIGDSSKLEVGEWVLAIGSPLGLDQTVTVGIVSGKGRAGRNMQMSGDRVREYIQTDAKINPGNSGGPLVNLDGEVVGMNTLIRVGAGGAYGFAVPINEAQRVAQALIKDGRMRYAFLGVNLGDVSALDPNMKQQLGPKAPTTGAVVGEVTPGSPAAKVGIRAGDVITKIDDREVKWAADVVDHVSTRGIGATVNVQLWRDGSSQTLRPTLAEAPSEGAAAGASGPLGFALQTLTPQLAESMGVPGARGAVISEVKAGSPAEQAGLQAGDIIVEVNRKAVANAEQAAALLQEKRVGGHLLRVRGPQGSRYVTIRN
jgi:serine protease Do